MATLFNMFAGDNRTLTIAITGLDGEPVDVSDALAVRFGIFRNGEEVAIKTLAVGGRGVCLFGFDLPRFAKFGVCE